MRRVSFPSRDVLCFLKKIENRFPLRFALFHIHGFSLTNHCRRLMSLIAARDDETFRVVLQMYQCERKLFSFESLSMEGFEGLITNEKLGTKSFSFRKHVDDSSRFFHTKSRVHSFMSHIFLNESAKRQARGMETRSRVGNERNNLPFAFVLYSVLIVLPSHSRSHSWRAIFLPSSPTFMVAVFHSAFPSLNFHWRIFPFSLPSRGLNFFSRLWTQNFWTFRLDPSSSWACGRTIITFRLEYCPKSRQLYLFVSSFCVSIATFSSLFIHHSLFVGKCQRKLFHNFQTLPLSFSISSTLLLSSRFSRSEKEKHFHSIKSFFVVFVRLKASRACVGGRFTYISILVNYFFLEWLQRGLIGGRGVN